MQARFLLGPAGSGKTFHCLAEIRAALLDSPEGLPLLLLAPKQATFQLERQLLADPALPGYTRLQILSFERLAEFILSEFASAPPRLLNEEGRRMVLRALLERKRDDLTIFRASARLPGFATHLSQLLGQIQRHQLSGDRLRSLVDQRGVPFALKDKLRDLSLLLGAYQDWLKQERLQDADSRLDLAIDTLAQAQSKDPQPKFALGGLWLDGFAEMTPQELNLLAILLPLCRGATLAFCLERQPKGELSWLSNWSVISQTFRQCHQRLTALAGCEIAVEVLSRDQKRTRFNNSVLQHLEQYWADPKPISEISTAFSAPPALNSHSNSALRVVRCANPEVEATLAAREILQFVRAGGRFRDVAVIVRQLDGYHDALRQTFERYEIPFFLDRREPVAHHPLAELVRYTLRMVAFGWEHSDWFGALKTGLTGVEDSVVDLLENEALARGWHGTVWFAPFATDAGTELGKSLETICRKIVPPFQKLSQAMDRLERRPTGRQLSQALRDLWRDLKVEEQLENWSVALVRNSTGPKLPDVHETVWEQMNDWGWNLDLAFANEALSLVDWLPIVESGLSHLTVGVIPPGLDQVLIGTIDRSRNPELHSVFLLGVNEGVFPAPPSPPLLFSEFDLDTLNSHNVMLGPNSRQQLGLERYYGYIACTRARKQLVITYATHDAQDRSLNPSPFIDHLSRLVPQLAVEEFSVPVNWPEIRHRSELVAPLLKLRMKSPGSPAVTQLLEALPSLATVVEKWDQLAAATPGNRLLPEMPERIYGQELKTSVSALEDFAACPFKFFAARGLCAQERTEFEMDPREKGSFQHEVLQEFHRRLQAQQKRWRDVTGEEAQKLVRQIGEDLVPVFRNGLFVSNPTREFTARLLIDGLEKLMQTLIGWTQQYEFEPQAVEVSFGLKESVLPPWRIGLDGERALLLRGRIDRMDLCHLAETGETLAVVIDYKSSARELDPVLRDEGLDLQLLAYLRALSELAPFEKMWQVPRLRPAGVFYVSTKGEGGSALTREKERANRDQARSAPYQHRGLFDGSYLARFDNRGGRRGDQFRYSKNRTGQFKQGGNEALPPEEFCALVSRITTVLQEYGNRIYEGVTEVAPFRWKNETACDSCSFRAVCRFDPWTTRYRVLGASSKVSPSKKKPSLDVKS